MNIDFYKQLIQYAPIGYAYQKVIYDKTGKPADYEFIEVNSNFEKFTDLKSEEIINHTFFELQNYKQAEIFFQNDVYRQVALTGDETEFEQYHFSYDKWYQVKVYSPEEGYLVTIFLDITKRKKLELAIKDESDFSREMIEGLPGIFYMLNEQGQFVMWNKNMKFFSDATEEQMKTLNAVSLFEGTDREKIIEAIQAIFRKGTSEVEAKLISLKGKRTPFYFSGKRIQIDEEYFLIGAGFDITERNKIQDALKQSEEKFKNYVEAAPVGIFVADLEGFYTLVNQLTCIHFL